LIVEEDVTAILEVYPGGSRIVREPCGGISLRTCVSKYLIQVLAAVLAPVEEAVAGEPNADVAVGIGAPGPDDDRRLVVTLCCLGDQRILLKHLDLHLEARLCRHSLNHLRELAFNRIGGDRQRESGFRYPRVRKQRLRARHVPSWYRHLFDVPGTPDRMRLVGRNELAIEHHLDYCIPVE